MWRGKLRPLPTELWLGEVTELLASCEILSPEAEDQAVRRAFHLAELSPFILRRLLTPAVGFDELEVLLDKGETEQAAAAVVGKNASVDHIGERSPGIHAVTFTMGSDAPVSFSGPSPALAIIGGWATYLLQLRNI